MAVTLRQVAQMSGVSVRTVSNVVNGFHHVAPETRERVQLVLDAVGYRPNAAARSLRTGRTGLVGLVVPALDQPYFAELTRAIVAHATEQGFTVVVDQTDGDPERERDLLAAGPRGAMFDGLILNPLALNLADLEASPEHRPVVLLGERTLSTRHDHVHIDNVAAARAATQHLISLGRRTIAGIGAQDSPSGQSARLRAEGMMTALAEAGLPAHPALLRNAPRYDRTVGYQQMMALLDGAITPDAVFCFSDMLAVGALRACAERGVRVPQDIALIGFDDVEETRFTTPSLSTIRPDKDAIARSAVERMVARMQGDTSPGIEVEIPFELVARESTGT